MERHDGMVAKDDNTRCAVRFVREVDGCIEHVTWFVDVDVLLAFIQQHYLEQAC